MEWVSSDHRLPRHGKTVFISSPKYPRGVTGFYSCEKGKWNIAEAGWNYWHLENTYWQELPEIPKYR